MEIMSTNESVWEDHHHRSSFLPNTSLANNDFVLLLGTDIVDIPQTPVLLQDFESEGNLCNITKTTPIDILVKPGTIEHVHIGKNCSMEETEEYRTLFKEFRDIFSSSYEEMPGIDPYIMVHEIKTYPTARPVRQKLHQSLPKRLWLSKSKSKKF